MPRVHTLPRLRSGLLALLAAAAASGAVSAPVAGAQIFAPSSYRNTPLSDSAPVDPLSSSYVLDLTQKVRLDGAFVNTTSYSTPVYTVPSTQPTQPVIVDNPAHNPCIPGETYGNPCLVEQWQAVPLPANPVPSAGTDGDLVVYQPSTDTMWEFWRFRVDPLSGQAHAVYGGRIQNFSSNPGYYTATPGTQFGVAATSIPLLAGLQQISELQAGAIDHVVSAALLAPQRGFRWPAQRGSGINPVVTAAKEGTCFRLPATLNLAGYNLSHYGLILATAIQRYGMVITDATATTGLDFYAEGPHDGTDPYGGPNGIFTGLDPSAGAGGVLRNFPWSKLQALAPGTC